MIKKNKNKINRILVDMSATLLHHGHIRLLKKASYYGKVIVGLSSDKDIFKFKGFQPELKYNFRKEILLSIKYVTSVIKINYYLNDNDLKKHKIDFVVHGNDNFNKVSKEKIKIFKRTPNISSDILRKKIILNSR